MKIVTWLKGLLRRKKKSSIKVGTSRFLLPETKEVFEELHTKLLRDVEVFREEYLRIAGLANTSARRLMTEIEEGKECLRTEPNQEQQRTLRQAIAVKTGRMEYLFKRKQLNLYIFEQAKFLYATVDPYKNVVSENILEGNDLSLPPLVAAEAQARLWEWAHIVAEGQVIFSTAKPVSRRRHCLAPCSPKTWDQVERTVWKYQGRYFLYQKTRKAMLRKGRKVFPKVDGAEMYLYFPTGDYSPEWETDFVTDAVGSMTPAEVSSIADAMDENDWRK